MDNLEKYIKDNRADFDTEIPSLKIWANVEREIARPDTQKRFVWQWVGRIAAAVALLIVGAGLGIFLHEQRTEAALNAEVPIAAELEKTEAYYNKQVANKLALLNVENPDPSVIADLKQIDIVQEELKKELKAAPTSTKEEIINHLIENYKIKLGILERVLEHIEEKKEQETKKSDIGNEKI